MSKPVIKKPEIPEDHKIQAWIDDRFGVPNTVNIQAYKDILSWGIDDCYKEMLRQTGEVIEQQIWKSAYITPTNKQRVINGIKQVLAQLEE